MVTARPINVERALVDPRAVFKEPIEVLALEAATSVRSSSAGAKTPWSYRPPPTRP
jgi:hypothetical protein